MTDKVVTMLPRAKERYQALVEGIGSLSSKNLPQAREQVRALVGEIRLRPTRDGYLEAIVTGRYEGLLDLLSDGKLNRGGCGGKDFNLRHLGLCEFTVARSPMNPGPRRSGSR